MKDLLCFRLVVALSLSAALAVGSFPAAPAAAEKDLCVALFSYVPDSSRFEKAIRQEWEKVHPEVSLTFADWDGYHDEPSEDLDLFVFDAIFLSHFVEQGYLLPIPEEEIQEKEDLVSFAMEGCRVDEVAYAVPQILCTNLLYTRKEDEKLSQVDDIESLYGILGDQMAEEEIPSAGGNELLIDMSRGTSKVSMYLDALCDVNQAYSAYEETPDMENTALDAIHSLRLLCQMGGADQVQYEPEDGDAYVRARWFAEGIGRAYIGYSEAMSAMGDYVSQVDFRPFSYAKEENIPLMAADVVGVCGSIQEEKKPLAFELLNILTGEAVMVSALSPDEEHAESQYLLPARASVYDWLSESLPAYGKLKDIVLNPENRLFLMGSNARAFISQAKSILPGLVF